MDQRGYFGSFEPAETDTPRPDAAASSRLQSWARMAAVRSARQDLIPTQREYAA